MNDRARHVMTQQSDDALLATLLAAWEPPGGTEPAEAGQHLMAALRTWLRSDGRLHMERLAGLGTPARARRQLRDHYLRQAAAVLAEPDASDWQAARRLAGAVEHFMGRRWPRWRGLADAPPHATRVEVLLHRAATVGDGAIPSTREGLLEVLATKPIHESP